MTSTPPLSKTLHPSDYALLPKELAIVDQFFNKVERPQHEARRWEYAMALHARHTWLQWDYETHGHANRAHGHRIFDVGGAGSPFEHILEGDNGAPVQTIDPDDRGGLTLAQHIRQRAVMAHEVYCLSVLEHVDDLDQFLYHLSCLVAPGGLLFLTFDYCDGFANAQNGYVVPDTYHYHWMRKRIFNVFTWMLVRQAFTRRDFIVLGGLDETFHGPQVFDYSFASLALVKRP